MANELDEEDDTPSDFAHYSQIDAVLGGRLSVAPVHLVDSCEREEEQLFDKAAATPSLSRTFHSTSGPPGPSTASPGHSTSYSSSPGPPVQSSPGPSGPSIASPGPSTSRSAIPGLPVQSTPGPSGPSTATPRPLTSRTATPGPSTSRTATPGTSTSHTATPSQLSDGEENVPLKKKIKRTTKVQQAEKATRSIV